LVPFERQAGLDGALLEVDVHRPSKMLYSTRPPWISKLDDGAEIAELAAPHADT